MKFTGKLIIILALAASAIGAYAFSLGGPRKNVDEPNDWQVPRIGYPDAGPLGYPMFIGEGYRLNVPVVTYAYDQSFINYFGTNGMIALDRAIQILNDLPPVSTITNDGADLFIRGERVPKQTKFVNFEAQALGLWDIKATALAHLLEEMGLTQTERWIWALRARNTPPNSTNFTVIQMNYDPITRMPSRYVNDTLYGYTIVDGNAVSDVFEFIVDPLSFGFNTVAGALWSNTLPGDFFTGLTYDDVGGLVYLYHTNNIVAEGLLSTITGGVPGGGGGGGGGAFTNFPNSPWLPFFFAPVGTNFANTAWQPFFFVSTNITNIIGNTNVFNTNTTFLVTNALRQGVNKVFFQRVAFDSIIGQTFVPITHRYVDLYFTNGQPVLQPVQRTIGVPDFVFTVEDLGVGSPSGVPFHSSRTVAFVNNDAINGSSTLGGPGIIAPPIQITFTDLYPTYWNTPPFLDDQTASNVGIWGSFDGSTNPPVVYPAGQNWSLEALRNLVLGGAVP